MSPAYCAQRNLQTDPAFRRSKVFSDALLDLFQAVVQGLPMDKQLFGCLLFGEMAIEIDSQRVNEGGTVFLIILDQRAQII